MRSRVGRCWNFGSFFLWLGCRSPACSWPFASKNERITVEWATEWATERRIFFIVHPLQTWLTVSATVALNFGSDRARFAGKCYASGSPGSCGCARAVAGGSSRPRQASPTPRARPSVRTDSVPVPKTMQFCVSGLVSRSRNTSHTKIFGKIIKNFANQ